jgi:putative ABC transport system substrate-binding protein
MRLIGLAVALTASLLLAPFAAQSQPARVARLGVLLLSFADPNLPAFRNGLQELGYIEGQNLIIDFRDAEGNPGRLGDLAVDLVQRKPDIILALGGDVAPFAKRATQTIPIVMVNSADPVKGGLVTSLARPGGNVTGVTFLSADLAGKRIHFLKEAAPAISRVGAIWNPDHPDDEMMEMQAAAGCPYKEALGVLGTALARDYQNAETHNLRGFAYRKWATSSRRFATITRRCA